MTQTLVKQLPTSSVIFKNVKFMPLKILNLVDENNFTNFNYSLIKEKFVKGNKEISLAPFGGAAFNNEYGRPNITGYFCTFAQEIPKVNNENGDIDILVNEKEIRGYHKPIMIAGGLGSIRSMHIHKKRIAPGTHLFVLGC
ncbi:1819_t:CDS:2 [Entrophospora sp. SA101]|nr:1819_t:CDS:2 [Entrophospora sp. SA101]